MKFGGRKWVGMGYGFEGSFFFKMFFLVAYGGERIGSEEGGGFRVKGLGDSVNLLWERIFV